jgi:AraC-like DNA-binding protein
MALDAYKELEAVHYGPYCARILLDSRKPPLKESVHIHWHDRMELLRIREGSMTMQIGLERVETKAGQLAVICPRQIHSGTAGSEGVVYDVIMFEPDQLCSQTAAWADYLKPIADGEVLFPPMTDQPELLAIADRLLAQYRCRETINPLRILSGVLELLGGMYEHLPLTQRFLDPREDAFRPVVDFVNRHFTDQISTAVLSRKFGYSEAYFCRRFKKATGLNPMKYIQILRLEYARELLQSSDAPLAELAQQCGYSDIYHFTHSFTRHFGESPSACRRGRGK